MRLSLIAWLLSITAFMPGLVAYAEEPKLALPSKGQLEWADLEFGMFVHLPVWRDDQAMELDTDGLAECASQMGARYLLVVAKHNNGYMQWVSKTRARAGVQRNQHNQGAGQRDILGELAAAARKRGLGLGIYNVPADWPDGIGDGGVSKDPAKQEAFRKDYIEQVRELFTNYGPLVEYWFDGGIPADFCARVNEVIKELQPNVCCFNGTYNPIEWCRNEEGRLDLPYWYAKREGHSTTDFKQDPRGTNAFAFVECDTPGAGGNNWLGGLSRPLSDLMDCYYLTVGRGGQLVINVSPPASASLKACTALGQAIRDAVGFPLATTNGAGAQVELDFGRDLDIDHVIVQEDLRLGQRVLKHKIEVLGVDGWQEVGRGENLGHKRIYRFSPVTARKVRCVADESLATPQIRSLYVTRTGIRTMDKEPPAAPTQATAAMEGRYVRLRWQAPATVPPSGIARYAVYRGGALLGNSTVAEFVDRDATEQASYQYTVTAISGCTLESARTAGLTFRTPADTTPPALVGMKQLDATHLVVQFSEPVDPAGKYRLDAGATVLNAESGKEPDTVLLTTSPLKELATHTLSVEDVRDRAKTPQAVAKGSTTQLRCVNGLLLYCPLNEGAGAEVIEQIKGTRLKVNGTNDWKNGGLVFSRDSTTLDLGMAPGYGADGWTLAIWAYPQRTEPYKKIPKDPGMDDIFVSRDRNNVRDYRFELGLNGYGDPFFEMSPPPGVAHVPTVGLCAGMRVATNTWCHAAVTRTPDGVFTLYVDGVPKATATSAVFHPYNPVANLYLGSQQHDRNGTVIPRFKGVLRDFRLYDRALSKEEVAELVKAGGR